MSADNTHQLYFYVVISSYGTGQRRDHDDYASGLDTKPLTNDIPLASRADPWDSRPSQDSLLNNGAGGYSHQKNLSHQHQRSMSGHSVSTVMAQPLQREATIASQSSYPPRQNSTRQPAAAYTQDPGPTPQWNDNYYSGGGTGTGMNKPLPSQAHPGES